MSELLKLAIFGALAFALYRMTAPVSGGLLTANLSPDTSSASPGVFSNLAAEISSALGGDDADVLARTIWGEARGETEAGKIAVGSVIRNRKNAGILSGWPSTYAGVCKQSNQFDCWNANDPNYEKVLSVTSADAAFMDCQNIAAGIIGGSIGDNTGGATFYHDTSITEPPSWISEGLVRVAQIDHLIFYRSA